METRADYFTKTKDSQRQALTMLGHPVPGGVAELDVPTIGIGAGPATTGQVIRFTDLLGLE